jgi:hypothetical protein
MLIGLSHEGIFICSGVNFADKEIKEVVVVTNTILIIICSSAGGVKMVIGKENNSVGQLVVW